MSFTGKSQLTTEKEIANDGFWPTLQIGDFLSKYRAPSELDNSSTEQTLVMSLIHVNAKLEAVKTLLQLNYETFESYLSDNSTPLADGELLHVHYEAAVFARAKAMLTKTLNTSNHKMSGTDSDEKQERNEDDWLDQSQYSIAAIVNHFFPDGHISGKDGFYASLM